MINMKRGANYLNLLGLAYRAGKCRLGTEGIIQDIRNQQAFLILIADDIAAQTRKKLTDKCNTFQIPYIEVDDRFTLGQALGKTERVAIALLDEGFAKKIQSLLL